MYDFETMQVHSGLDDLANNESTDVFRQTLPPSHVLVEILPIDILSHDIDMGFALERLLILDDLRMRYDLHYLTLIIQNSDSLVRQFLRTDVLQRKRFTCLLRSTSVNNRKLSCPYHLVRVVQVMQRVPLIHLIALQITQLFRLTLKVKHTSLIILITMIHLNTEPVLVLHSVHRQSLKIDGLERRTPFAVGSSDDQNSIDQHHVDFPHLALQLHRSRERPLHLRKIVRFPIVVTPNIDMKTSVVMFEEFIVRLNPLRKLFICESISQKEYIPVFTSILYDAYIFLVNSFTNVIMLQ